MILVVSIALNVCKSITHGHAMTILRLVVMKSNALQVDKHNYDQTLSHSNIIVIQNIIPYEFCSLYATRYNSATYISRSCN